MFEFWLENNKDITAVSNYLKRKIPCEVDNELNKLIYDKARNICNYTKLKWDKHLRNAKVFRKCEKDWLAREIVFVIPKKIAQSDDLKVLIIRVAKEIKGSWPPK